MTTHPGRVQGDSSGLPDELSARRLLSRSQGLMLALGIGAVLVALVVKTTTGIGPSALFWVRAVVTVTTVVFVSLVVFRSVLVFTSSRQRVPRRADGRSAIPDDDLPAYTVLVPLRGEESVLPLLARHLSALDYPRDRLRILLLIEHDDPVTQNALEALDLGTPFEIVVVPEGGPRTKPNACNVGLALTDSEFCVIYDAEDRPDLDQLRNAVAALRHSSDDVVCVQAELAYWNPWTNWLTRAFAAEYALNFALTLRGLDRFRMPIPLGGTSNHFRVAALRELGGWDAYNVTEDADLGVRIARHGCLVRMLDSVTWEEANSRVGNWIRQRSRWIKGHMQTWLVHTRHPRRLLAELGPLRFVSFQFTFLLTVLAILLNPIFWSFFLAYLVDGPDRISVLYPPIVLYLGTVTMLAGNLITIYHFIIACMIRGLYRAVPMMVLMPLYWLLMSVAAYRALTQLVRPTRRHYWELTRHGLVREPQHQLVFHEPVDGSAAAEHT